MTNKKLSNKGKATRQHILEIAAELFAEKGYAYTTSKEICEKSGANIAAVNYHFGSREGLYNEVLLVMHDRLITLDTLNQISHSQLSAQEKLASIIDEIMKSIVERKWYARMFIRELLSPSAALTTLLTQKILPKIQLIKEVISEFTAIPVDHPTIKYCLINVIAPNAVLLVANEQLLNQSIPNLTAEANNISQHLKTYSFAGLNAIAKAFHTKHS